MNQKRLIGALLAVGLLTIVANVGATVAQKQAALAAQAKVSMKAAKATALAKVPGGKFKASELERENGKLIYSFEIVVPGRSGIEEVNVSAISGKVLSVEHEGARKEAKEAKQEKAEAHGAH